MNRIESRMNAKTIHFISWPLQDQPHSLQPNDSANECLLRIA
jgi:hypothetical protein